MPTIPSLIFFFLTLAVYTLPTSPTWGGNAEKRGKGKNEKSDFKEMKKMVKKGLPDTKKTKQIRVQKDEITSEMGRPLDKGQEAVRDIASFPKEKSKKKNPPSSAEPKVENWDYPQKDFSEGTHLGTEDAPPPPNSP